MPLQRQVISWPLTGGLDSKTAPLQIQPGSHIALDNVRQERTNEWRARNGTTKSSDDTIPGSLPALRSIVLPGGSLWAMIRPTAFAGVGAVRSYAPSVAAGINRWTSPPLAQSSQLAPSCWSRTPTATIPGRQATTMRHSLAVGGGYALAVSSQTAVNGIEAYLTADSGGDTVTFTKLEPSAQITALATAFCANRICAFWVSGNNFKVASWNTSTGAVAVSTTTLTTDAQITASYLDAITYSGSTTITIVYRIDATNNIKFIEYDPVANTLSTSVTLAVNCSSSLSLFPDPDTSGIRFVAAGTSVPDVRVLRVNSAGAIQTNDQAHATLTATQVAGCAYQAGAGWTIIARTNAGLVAVKKRTAVISAPVAIMATTPLNYYLDSNAWREPSTDAMRVIIGLHGPDGVIAAGSPLDPQDTFYEMAFAFEDGSATMTHYYPEPQARMLPLNAGRGPDYSAGLPQVTRLSADKFSVPLLRTVRVSKSGNELRAVSGSGNTYCVDRWTVQYVNTSNVATLPQGQGVISNDCGFLVAGQLLQSSSAVRFTPHGSSAIAFRPILTPSAGAGGLTPLTTYQYVVTEDFRDEKGNLWHGPPSIPETVTLAAGQNTVSVVCNVAPTENAARIRVISLWRTKADGSVFQLVGVGTIPTATTATIVDLSSDTNLAGAEFLPVSLPVAITPAVSAVALYGLRMWAIDRDFPSSLWFTRTLRAGSSPEFVAAFQLSFLDEEGDMTNLAQLDDKLIVFKDSAIYFVQGDGPDDNGGGSFPVPTRVDSDVGSIAGSPVVSTGQEVFFVSLRGIYMIDRSLQVQFVGAPVDQYLNQPLVQTRETVIGAVFSPATNEVRFQTTNYRLVYDRLRGLWYRDTGAGMQNVVSTCMVGSKQALFKSDGTMWLEGDETVKQDNGVSFVPTIRSAWIRPSGTDGRLRLYMARIIMTRTAGGGSVTPSMSIFYDNDDTIVETFTPAAIGGATLVSRGSVQPRRHRCSAFSLLLTLPGNDVSLRLDAWGAEVGMRSGAFRNNSGTAERWT